MSMFKTEVVAKWLSYTTAGILVLLPFHAFLTTWAGTTFGDLDMWRIWKELIIFGMFPVVLWLAWQDRGLRKWLVKDKLPKLILLFMLLNILSGYIATRSDEVNSEALIYGLLANLRFFGFFMVVVVVSHYNNFLSKHWWRLFVWPSLLVITFALLQLVLPDDFLRHFGYGPATIDYLQTVDNKADYQRLQSTLRGANPLGAYLVLIIPALLIWPLNSKFKRLGSAFVAGIVMVLTYSRSAYIGLVLAIGTLYYPWAARRVRQQKKHSLLIVAACLTVGVFGLLALREVNVVQNILFHSDETSKSSQSSNESRLRAQQVATRQVVNEPLGRGVGTAGPASVRNDQPARIAENYYLQIAQETGWLGITVLLAIFCMVATRLMRLWKDDRAKVLLASFVGLAVVNLLSHAWMDDTISLLWWGLAAIVLSGTIQKTTSDHE